MSLPDDSADTTITTPQEANTKATEPPSLTDQVSDAEFALLILRAFPQEHHYLLDVSYFAQQLGMKDAAFKKRLQRLGKDVPELEVFRPSMSTKFGDSKFNIIDKPPARPPRKPRVKGDKPTGVGKAKKTKKTTEQTVEAVAEAENGD